MLDMSGNVWEWCLSKWANPYQHPEDNDEEGTDDRGTRVLRGGSWNTNQYNVRCASRFQYFNFIRYYYFFGFRVCASPCQPTF